MGDMLDQLRVMQERLKDMEPPTWRIIVTPFAPPATVLPQWRTDGRKIVWVSMDLWLGLKVVPVDYGSQKIKVGELMGGLPLMGIPVYFDNDMTEEEAGLAWLLKFTKNAS